ncbi:dTDP-glucose 4,6-dehydratase [Clostridium oryzae]|uniref:dTDP-glucose 4,6-dehydratase n=1 Tax=Clostridium oryzae TaxID=1450648 RepID=A0A1V4ILJ7_9CLOT|nr:dTDP-glucose 4,6-dehydratase [Clostridium oryzae]OPJ60773.1 dTDP-glucose 4,6-dehydratase 2 [Clostridium oryzae]
MKTYLVTGGAGFIGSNFIQYLFETYKEDIRIINLDLLTYAANLENLKTVESNKNYQFIKGDVCDKALVTNLLSAYNVDYIVHFAAETHVDRSIESSDEFVRTNILGTMNLLDCSKAAWESKEGFKNDKRFLYVSTDEVYGESPDGGYFTEETPIAPRNPYSASKASADMMAKAYYDTYHFPVIRTRCSNNYGPHQFTEKLIPLLINNCIANKKLPIYGDGLAVRDWLYVKDHCRAIDLAITKGRLGDIYNVGGHNEKNTLEIAETIVNLLNQEYNFNIPKNCISFVSDRKGHDRRYAIDPTKIRTKLGWNPKVKFEDGIRQTIDWYLENN